MRQETNCLPISLPLLSSRSDGTPPSPGQRLRAVGGIFRSRKVSIVKILVVDDSEAFRKVMIELLVRVGFHDVAEAESFDSALEVYKRDRPKISFVDMVLPGKNGVDLTRAIVSLDPKATVIAMSSIINKKMIRESLEAGAKDFLLKPTNEIALSSVLTMWSD